MSITGKELAVAADGRSWLLADVTIHASTVDGWLLWSPNRPVLAVDPNSGRYRLGLTVIRRADATVGGTALVVVAVAPLIDPGQLRRLWLAGRPGPPPRFLPLPMRQVRARLLLGPDGGSVLNPAGGADTRGAAVSGGMVSFLLDLPAEEARRWADTLRRDRGIPAGVRITYRYPRRLPDTGARVLVHGRRALAGLAAALPACADGRPAGDLPRLRAAWRLLVAEGSVEVVPLARKTLADGRELLETLSDQAMERMFDSLFEPLGEPELPRAEGPVYALAWRRACDAVDLTVEVRCSGWTWLDASIDADFSGPIDGLDERYLNEISLS
jgi:hypothetical protein